MMRWRSVASPTLTSRWWYIYGHSSSFTFLSSHMLYLINVVLRIDCFFVAVSICSHPTLRWTTRTIRWWWAQEVEGSGLIRILEHDMNTSCIPKLFPRGPTQLQRRYNYHRNSWLYFYHIILLKWILLQQVSVFLLLEGHPMTGNETI
jgi:hypothetical protein